MYKIPRRKLLQAAALSGFAVAPAALSVFAAASPAKSTIGFGIGTYGAKTMKTADALRLIADTGYDGVEPALMPGWPTDPRQLSEKGRRELRSLLAQTGLAVPALLEALPIGNMPEQRRYNIERLKLAMDLGNQLVPSNPPIVETILGRNADDWDRAKDRMAEELAEWARVAEAAKTTVCFKPHAAQAVNSPQRALWLLEQVRSSRLRIVYDYSHFYLEGFPLESSLKTLLPYIAYIAVKDSLGTPAKHDYLLPGDGKTDYLRYFKLLKELQYDGFVAVEVSAMIQKKPGYQPAPTARLCYQRLAPLFAKAGIFRPARRAKALTG
jgi:inosose dehydratase